MRKFISKMLVAALAVLPFGGSAFAGGEPTELGPIVLPVDAASVANEIAAAGGSIALYVIGAVTGVVLIYKIFRRVLGRM